MASLKNKTLIGIFWTFIEKFSVAGISFVVQIILARLLMPQDFGLIAMVTVFIGLGDAIVDSGMSMSLIRTKEPNQRDFSTIFILNVTVSVVFYIIVFFLAPSVAKFYDQPQLINILRCFALVVPIKSFMAVQNAILTIEMDFKTQFFIQLPSLVISSILAIILAFIDYGVWALIIMRIMMALLTTIQYWFYSKWRPKFVFDKEKFKYHFDFGYKQMLTTIIKSISLDINNIIIGKNFSSATLGIYNRASTFQKIPSKILGTAVNKVTYPLFSKLIHDSDQIKHALRRLNKIILFFFGPISFFLIINAELIITTVLTEKWIECVPIFQILFLAGLFQPLQFYNTNIIRSYGRTDIILKINTFFQIYFIATVLLIIKFGLLYLVIFEAFNITFLTIIFIHYSGKHIQYSFLQQLKDFSFEITLTLVTSLVAFFCFKSIDLGIDILNIIVLGLLYFTVFFFLAYIFKSETLFYIVKQIKGKFK